MNRSNKITKTDHFNFIAMVFCFWFATYIYIPVFGVYLEEINFSYASIGVILGSYGITQILFRFPLGIISNKFQRIQKDLLVIGFVLSIISSLILIFFESMAMILIARLLVGVTASVWVMATVLYSNYFNVRQAVKAMGIMQFVTVATQFLGMMISGYLVYKGGWNLPYWIGLIASIIGMCFSFKIKTAENFDVKSLDFNIKSIVFKTVRIPNLLFISFVSMVTHSILFITIFGFSPIVASMNGVNEEDLFWIVSAFFIPHITTSFIFMICDFSQPVIKKILMVSIILTPVFIVSISFSTSLFTLSACHFGLGLSLGLLFPILLGLVVKRSPSDLKVSAMGFYQSFYAIGIFLGPLMGGKVADKYGLDQLFVFSGVFCLLLVILCVVWSGKILKPEIE